MWRHIEPIGSGEDCSPSAQMIMDVAWPERVLGAWMATGAGLVDGRQVVAVDGKSLRVATNAASVMPHLVATLDQASGAVLG